jgi:hypothetical protein
MAYGANTYEGGDVAAVNLQQIENNFEYLRTSFKSSSAPADPGGGLEGVVWWDSNKKNFKGRSNSAWRALFSGSSLFKIWAYLDAAEDGWTRDSNPADQVLSLKGGTTYTTGAQYDKGSWTITGVSVDSHNHQWHKYDSGKSVNQRSRSWQSNGSTEIVISANTNYETGGLISIVTGGADPFVQDASLYTKDNTATTTSDGTWRLKAAVGILVGPDV